MENLQATFEIAVDLCQFFNIDVFQRGFYNVSVEFEDLVTNKSNLEVHLLNSKDDKNCLPAIVSEKRAVSKTVQILHKRQDVSLNHTFLFRCHRLINSNNIIHSISNMKFRLMVKLWFYGSDDVDDISLQKFEEVSTRTIQFQVDPVQGLHGFNLLVFEYGVMAGVEMAVHASLVALHQPLLQTLSVCRNNGGPNYQTVTLESILFPVSSQSITTLAIQLDHAIAVHNSIIDLLLSIYMHLKNYLMIVSKHLPGKMKYTHEFAEALIKINAMQETITHVGNRDELLDQANMNLASACSYVLALWSHILELVCLNRNIIGKLALMQHKQRIQRFQSFFFTITNPRDLFDEQRSALYNFLASEVRSLPYFQCAPPLLLEALEMDGVSNPIPILFEDKYDHKCTSPPIFQQKSNNNVVHPAQKPSLLKVGHDRLSSSTTSSCPELNLLVANPAIEFNSKCLSHLADQTCYASGAEKFSKEIVVHTLEEPDDLPVVNSLLYAKGGASISPACNFTGPGYIRKQLPSQGRVVDGAVDCDSDSAINQSVCSHSGSAGGDIEIAGVSLSLKEKRSKVVNMGPDTSSNDNDMLTLEAFLEADFNIGELRDAVCEPSDLFAANHQSHFLDAAANDNFEGLAGFNNADSLMQKLEAKHAAEKSKLLGHLQFPGHLFSDLPFTIPLSPYLSLPKMKLNKASISSDSHLIVFVHGLDGTGTDMRTVKTYLELGLEAILKSAGQPRSQVSYLMSSANEKDTYDDIQIMTNKLVDEILCYIKNAYFSKSHPKRISFIGHSLGGLLIRSAVTNESLKHLRPRFHTFLSFSAPHLGTVLNSSTLVNTGLWLIQKFKKSACLRQLSCKEKSSLKETFIYKLSKKKGLEFFKNILLVACADDRYVPYQSARIEMCRAASKDKALGSVYQEMVNNIMTPVLQNPKINLRRYHVVHSLSTATANAFIGRAAHIAVLESEIFLEQFFLVAALQYFI